MMRRIIHFNIQLWGLALVLALLSGCSSAASQATPQPTVLPPTDTPVLPTATLLPPADTPEPPTLTASPLPPSDTPTATETPAPSDTPLPTETPTNTAPPPTPSGKDAIYIYYVRIGSGGSVACGDSLVSINTGAWRTGDIAADVGTALTRLFAKRKSFGELVNPIYLSNLEVQRVTYKAFSGVVNVDLVGTYVRSGDRCDDSRVREQVWTTIRQFPGVKGENVLLNGNLLGDILATGK